MRRVEKIKRIVSTESEDSDTCQKAAAYLVKSSIRDALLGFMMNKQEYQGE